MLYHNIVITVSIQHASSHSHLYPVVIIIIIIMGDLYSAFHSTRRFTKISIHSGRNIFKETSFKHSK